jgi:hypothetical protein
MSALTHRSDGTSGQLRLRLPGLVLAVAAGSWLALAVTLSARAAPAAPPPSFVVNSASDVPAAAPLNDGHCATAKPAGVPNGVCTLRAAVMAANHWSGGGATITFAPVLNGVPLLLGAPQGPDDEASGDLNISQTTRVLGSGAGLTIIDARSHDRVFWIEPGAVATLSGLTLQNGLVTTNGGGGVYVDAGAALTLDHSDVLSNTDQSSSGGGGLNNQGTLTITHSLLRGNSTTAVSGGGGLNADNGTAIIIASTISGNQATNPVAGGGGVINIGLLMTVTQSTISGNQAAYGGGLEAEYGQVSVINSTLSDNSATTDGGGLLMVGSITQVTLYNVTVAGNQAGSALDRVGLGGGVAVEGSNALYLQNSLLAGNLGSIHFFSSYAATADDCDGLLTSNGYILIETKLPACSVAGSIGDQLNSAPAQLGPLQANGGPTLTQALLPGSPAIDAGNPSGCNDPLGAPLAADQRGRPRVANGAGLHRCDIGAYEVQRILDLPLVLR